MGSKLSTAENPFSHIYRNDPRFMDKQVWTNSADPEELAGGETDQGLHCLPFHLHFLTNYSVVKQYCSNFRVFTPIFLVSEFLGFLWYSMVAPLADWLRSLIFGALKCSSSQRCGFEPSSGHM